MVLNPVYDIESAKLRQNERFIHVYFLICFYFLDEYSTGEEYDYEYRVDPDRHVKSFNGTDIGITNPTEVILLLIPFSQCIAFN